MRRRQMMTPHGTVSPPVEATAARRHAIAPGHASSQRFSIFDVPPMIDTPSPNRRVSMPIEMLVSDDRSLFIFISGQHSRYLASGKSRRRLAFSRAPTARRDHHSDCHRRHSIADAEASRYAPRMSGPLMCSLNRRCHHDSADIDEHV
jgi:hypothetical protein